MRLARRAPAETSSPSVLAASVWLFAVAATPTHASRRRRATVDAARTLIDEWQRKNLCRAALVLNVTQA